MTATQTEIQAQVIGLSAEAFEAFCEDISGMFDVDMECSQQEFCTETVKGLKKRFKKLASVNSIKAEGALDGTFQIVFDKNGLFTLAGVIVMLPEQKILENSKRASAKAAEEMADAVKESGNMLVGSWDRVFREDLEGHKHFVQTNTFIGDPWGNPEENIGLAGDEEFLFVPFEMTIGSYPAFNCGVIFPKAIFGQTSETKPQQPDIAEEKPQEEQVEPEVEQETQEPQSDVEQAEPEKPEESAQKADEESKPAESVAEETVETTKQKEQGPAEEKPEAEQAASQKDEDTVEPQSETVAQPEQSREPAVENDRKAPVEKNPKTEGTPVDAKDVFVEGGVFETIQKMTQSSATLPGGASAVSLAISAKEIMQKQIAWITPEDSVQNAFAKMQQVNSGYMLVGTNGVMEGILSKSDIVSAVSIYLRPIFAKWRRPIDDATLNIRVKWIMTRPVHTIKPDTSLAAIIENMSRFGGKCMPVIEQQGKVAGLVTVFDIFKALLNSASDASVVGESLQVPSLT